MDLSRPYSVFSPSADPDVLAALAQTGRPLSGREVAKRAGRAQDWVRRVLDRLVAQGIVERERAGSAFVYELNREHLAAPAIEQLVGLRALLVDRLREEIGAWAVAPASATLFGSAARGDGGVASDIDILVVSAATVDGEEDRWRDQIDRLADQVLAWTGNHASIVDIGEDDLAPLLDRSPPVLDSIRAEGIHLAGRRIDALLRGLG